MCSANSVQEEMHVLCSCNFYTALRNVMYNRVSQRNVTLQNLNIEDKYQYLMSIEWKELGNFLDKMWSLRAEKLYRMR